MFAGLPPSSSDLTERKSVVPPSPPADRRREHRESAAVVLTRRRKACLHTRPPISGARSGPLIDGVGLRGTACLWQAVPKRSTRTGLMASVLAGAERREAARRDERDLFSP